LRHSAAYLQQVPYVVAILWQKTTNGTRYEVRKAGNSIRLFTDGVFHSQYNPTHPITRSVWDLLMLPALFYAPGEIKRVLVLGVGGGSVIQLLHRYIGPKEIVGIELNPVHLTLAKRFFRINRNMATLHQADAIRWLQEYQGPPFDMIIDDLFGEVDGEGVRATPLNGKWFNLLRKHTTRHGLVVVNMVNPASLQESAYFSNRHIAASFPSAFQLTHPGYHNIIAAFVKKRVNSNELRQRLKQTPGLHYRSGPNKLTFRIKQLITAKP
jgi:spermidine synthase